MFGWMRVEELIRFVAPFYPTWDHKLAAHYLRQFELPPRTKVKQLSKGQNVRLGFLLALAHRPKLVVLDDPALGLDPIMRKEFNRDLITNLQGEGRTIFYSSHLLYEVEPIADSVAILDGGVIVKQAPTKTLRQDVKQIIFYRQAYAACRASLEPLDVRRSADQEAVTVDRAPETIAAIQASDCPHRVVDLSLDELFEAYVIGVDEAAGAGWLAVRRKCERREKRDAVRLTIPHLKGMSRSRVEVCRLPRNPAVARNRRFRDGRQDAGFFRVLDGRRIFIRRALDHFHRHGRGGAMCRPCQSSNSGIGLPSYRTGTDRPASSEWTKSVGTPS